MHIVNVPVGHVHGFSFEPGTQGWVLTIAAEVLDEALLASEGLRGVLSQSAVLRGTPQIRTTMKQIFAEFAAREVRRAHVLRALSAALIGLVARELASMDRGSGAAESGAIPPLRGADRTAPSGALERVGLCRGAVGDGDPSQPGDARRDRRYGLASDPQPDDPRGAAESRSTPTCRSRRSPMRSASTIRPISAGCTPPRPACRRAPFARNSTAARSDASHVEEHRFVRPLQVDGEIVDDLAGALAAPGDQGRSPHRLLDQIQHGVGRVGGIFVREIDPGVEADIDAACDNPDVDVRRAFPSRLVDGSARLDGLEGNQPGVEIRSGAAPAAEIPVDGAGRTIGRMIVAARRIGLPDLEQHVAQRRTGAVEHPTFERDPLAFGVRAPPGCW